MEGVRAFRYQPKQATHPAIRLELYFDAVLVATIGICIIGLLAHALVPWVTEHSENLIFIVLISSLTIFAVLATISIKIAVRSPRGD